MNAHDWSDSEMLLIDKPAGLTSFGVVARVRRKLSDRAGTVAVKGKDGIVREKRKKVKVGHTGTLDPFATGLLIILTGKGTKHTNDFLKLDKEYIATIRLGATSDTGDVEGNITEVASASDGQLKIMNTIPMRENNKIGSTKPSSLCEGNKKENLGIMPVPTIADIERAVDGFRGEIEQRVPNYSAVKINGERAYKLARAGKAVEMPVRRVKIHELEILDYQWPELTLRCKVSSGTYIRALGEDIGKALGVGGYLTALRRTQVGQYRVEEAKPLDDYLAN